jgi:hypothetical protein
MSAKLTRGKIITLTALMLCLLPAVASRVSAATLSEYRNRVSEAATAIQQLHTPDNFAGDLTRSEETIAATLARVRTLLPANETILFKGQTFEADNSWLHDTFSEYERIKTSSRRSADLFRRTAERLRALLGRLNELDQVSASADKDASKARMAEILRRPEFNKSAAQGSALERLWERFIRWLSGLFPKTKPLAPGTGRALSSIAQVVVIAICVALIAFLIWKFLPRFLRGRGKKKTKREARIVLGEHLDPDQSAADLLEQAEGLARAGDLRGAIRKAYIALLCELGDRKVISLAQHKTNRDYLMSVRHKTSLYQSMRKLTSSFELHWYGFVPPAPNDWDEFRLGCRNAVISEK